jgi:hypothetical protein
MGSVGVFPPTGSMHLISTLSLQAGHTSRKIKGGLIDFPNLTSEVLNLQHAH